MTLLIVEDDPDIRELLSGMFAAFGFVTFAATNGADAFRAAIENGLRPSAILLDLGMPIMSGTEFLRRQHEQPLLADVPVVVMSARTDQAIDLPATVRAVVEKPVSMQALVSLVRNVCRAPTLAAGSERRPRTGSRRPAIEDRGVKIDEADLELLEISIGTRLQIDYREFLLEHNGGVPVPSAFRVDDAIMEVERFYSVRATRPLDDLATRRVALRRLVPPELLAIGRDTVGDLLCLGLEGESFGAVYHFAIDRSSRIRKLLPIRIARSFPELLDGLSNDAHATD